MGCLDEPSDEVGVQAAALTPVTWTDVVGASAVGNDLAKTSSSPSWNAGAVSVQRLVSDGYVEFGTGEVSNKIAGLSSSAYSFSRVASSRRGRPSTTWSSRRSTSGPPR